MKDIIGWIILGVLLLAVLVLLLIWIHKIFKSLFDGFELLYHSFLNRPLLIYFHLFLKDLDKQEVQILESKFPFYKRLSDKHKRFFRHRVVSFIKSKTFLGKDGFEVTGEVEVLIAATGVMLTFGFRDFKIKSIKDIIIYPTEYYSNFSKTYNKGEYNFNLKTLVLSWDNFVEGYSIKDDKLNLGIHEFSHAIHFHCLYAEDIYAIVFVDKFNGLRTLLESDNNVKEKLITSGVLREYGYTNGFELVAVIIETFIETPQDFKSQFPEIYSTVKQMLNFNFPGY